MFHFLKSKKGKDKDSLLQLIRDGQFSGTPISLIGNSPARKARFITDVLTPMAIDAGQSFSVLRQSEGLLLEECIKERCQHGLSILSAKLQSNNELNEHLADIVAKQSASKPTHIIIRYPDDQVFFNSHKQAEVKFITSCISSFSRSLSAKLGEDLESVDSNKDVIDATHLLNKRIPVYFGDMDRYLLDNDFLSYLMVVSSQMRALGYQCFFNQVVSNKHDLGEKLWELSSAHTLCRVLIESDPEKAKMIAQELNRYVDARFHGEIVSFEESCLSQPCSDTSCAVYPDKSKIIAPRTITLG